MVKGKHRQNANLAAEYFVASQLFRRGYIVTVTFGNTKQVDLVVLHPDHKRKATIDVKGLKNKTNWPMPKKPLVHPDHFYVLVSFKNNYDDLSVSPEVFVVPSKDVKNLWTRWSKSKTKQRAITYGRVRDRNYKDSWDSLFKS